MRESDLYKRIAGAALLALLAVQGCGPTPPPKPAPPPPAGPVHPVVGGAQMDPARTILDNIRRSSDHEVLTAAINATGIGQTLSETRYYTLFAPGDAAFGRLPKGTMEALMDPASRNELSGLVHYHIIPGSLSRSQIEADVNFGRGSASYRTLQGTTIRVTIEGQAIILSDLHGRRSRVMLADVRNSNGTIHVVDALLLPPN